MLAINFTQPNISEERCGIGFMRNYEPIANAKALFVRGTLDPLKGIVATEWMRHANRGVCDRARPGYLKEPVRVGRRKGSQNELFGCNLAHSQRHLRATNYVVNVPTEGFTTGDLLAARELLALSGDTFFWSLSPANSVSDPSAKVISEMRLG